MDRFAKWANPPEVPLFHYTDTNGLIGIAEKCEMWATHVRHLNDTAEYFNALDRIKGASSKRELKTRPTAPIRGLLIMLWSGCVSTTRS